MEEIHIIHSTSKYLFIILQCVYVDKSSTKLMHVIAMNKDNVSLHHQGNVGWASSLYENNKEMLESYNNTIWWKSCTHKDDMQGLFSHLSKDLQ